MERCRKGSLVLSFMAEQMSRMVQAGLSVLGKMDHVREAGLHVRKRMLEKQDKTLKEVKGIKGPSNAARAENRIVQEGAGRAQEGRS